METRNFFFKKKILRSVSFPLPVISIGNLAVGGTGKTPHTEYLINLLKEEYKIAVLSRGYKRATKGFVLADESASAKTIGDEPFQIFGKFPQITVAVDEKRVHGVQEILKIRPDTEVVLLDDAFQHQYITPGLSILLTDYGKPFTRDFVLPYGRLRENKKNAQRADIIIVTKCPRDISPQEMEKLKTDINPKQHQTVFFSGLKYGKMYSVFNEVESVPENTDVLMITGIENPKPMTDYLRGQAKYPEAISYADHHDFTKKELEEIEKKSEGKIIITTEKDAARLKSNPFLSENLRYKIYALPLEIQILNNQENTFNQKMKEYVGKNSGNR